METIIINKLAHLGDVIVILILAQNRGITNNWIINIKGPEHHCIPLFELFNFTNLIYDGPPNNININSSIFTIAPENFHAKNKLQLPSVPFLKINQFELTKKENAKRSDEIILPTCNLNTEFKNDIHCFQFDSRSIHHGKRQLTTDEIEKTLNKFAGKSKKVAIGGLETKKYIDNYEYKLGNLQEITKFLLQSKQFIGIDSGLSHLAGLLKIPSNIILISTISHHQIELIKLYKTLYKNVNCYTLNDLNNFKTIKML